MLTESSIRDKTEALRTVMMRLPWPLGENRNRRLEGLYIFMKQKTEEQYILLGCSNTFPAASTIATLLCLPFFSK